MLFDLRSRGRRRTVQVVYLGLAGLMALGLIGFGIGGGFGGGGLVEGLKNGGSSGPATFAQQVAAAEKRVEKHPSEAAAWAALAQADLHEASASAYYDPTTETYTAKGKQELRRVAGAWEHYVKLEPKNPSPSLAQYMATVFSTSALNEPAKAVEALQIVIAAKPESAALYSSLAEYAYLSHNEREGDLASSKAISLAPKSKRPLLELEFDKMKKKAKGEAAPSVAGGSTSSSNASATSRTSTTSKLGASRTTGASKAGSTSSTKSGSTTAAKKK